MSMHVLDIVSAGLSFACGAETDISVTFVKRTEMVE